MISGLMVRVATLALSFLADSLKPFLEFGSSKNKIWKIIKTESITVFRKKSGFGDLGFSPLCLHWYLVLCPVWDFCWLYFWSSDQLQSLKVIQIIETNKILCWEELKTLAFVFGTWVDKKRMVWELLGKKRL